MKVNHCTARQQYQAKTFTASALSDSNERKLGYATLHKQMNHLANALRLRIQQNVLILGE